MMTRDWNWPRILIIALTLALDAIVIAVVWEIVR
jgi:hypothetical protein